MNIKGKIALITGGAHRIGKVLTLSLAAGGANVVINYNSSRDEALTTAREAKNLGVGALPVQADISKLNQVVKMIDTAHKEFGAIDIFVHSAATFMRTPFPLSDIEKWHRVINTMVHGSFYCANTIAPVMNAGGGGVMIFIVDLSALEPMQNYIAHSIGKSSILALSKNLAVELAPTIRVNAIAPGQVLPPDNFNEDKINRSAQKNLLNRWGDPEDVAKTVMFLIESDFITGELIIVDGGERLVHRTSNLQG